MGTIKYLILISVLSFPFRKMCFAEPNITKSENVQQEIIIPLEDKMKVLFSSWQAETNHKLDLLEKYIDDKLNTVETNISEKIKHNMSCNSLEIFENNMNSNLNALSKNISKEFIDNSKVDAVTNENMTAHYIYPVTQTISPPLVVVKLPDNNTLPCKEEALSSYGHSNYFSMDGDTYKYISAKRNESGHLLHFEMHMSIQADEYLIIYLTDKGEYSRSKVVFDIFMAVESKKITKLDFNGKNINRIHTPNILSRTKFRDFYIKIYDGKLEFGKEGDSTPLISHYDARVLSLNYFAFSYYGSYNAKIRYDCPLPVIELPYKQESLMVLEHSRHYSMSNSSWNHVTFEKTSTGAGWLTYFEMHLAIQAEEFVVIWLSNKDNYTNSTIRYEINIGVGRNEYTDLNYQGTTLKHVYTPNILSSTRFREFYIKIDDGNLEFGNEGESIPVLSHYHAHLQSVDYFAFNNYGVNKTNIRFDCPAPEEDLYCKEESSYNFGEVPAHLMDDGALKHVSLRRTSIGLLSYFKMHFDIKSEDDVIIQLWSKGTYLDSDIQYSILIGGKYNEYTEFYAQGKKVQHVQTPGVLVSYLYKAFYIQIENGKLEFGKGGGSSPLITYNDIRFQSVNYFGFSYSNETSIRYDCPAPFEALPCKTKSLSSYQHSPSYSMDEKTYKHIEVERNSTGHLTYFKLHVALQGGAELRLWDKEEYYNSNAPFSINVGLGDAYTTLYFEGSPVQRVHTRNILPPTQLRFFYIKIDNGNLEFGKESSSKPIISYRDERLASANYFSFSTWGGSLKFGYDCPAPVEGSPSTF